MSVDDSRQRTMLQLEPVAREEPEAAAPGFPAPAVLVAQPSLSSAPGPLPVIRDARPDTVLDGAEAGAVSVRAASVRGDAHRFAGETRQDAMAFWTAEVAGAAVLVACVADGVGSEPLSHIGSETVCRALRDEIGPELDVLAGTDPEAVRESCAALSERVARTLSERTEQDRVHADAYATTLTVAVLVPDDDGARLITLRVGDSSALVLSADGWRPCFGKPDDDMFSPRTDALPRHAAALEVAVARVRSGEVLLLCTDGLGGPMRSAEVRDALAGWWGTGRVPELPAFLWQLSFRAKSFSDDRTAICAWVR